MKICDYSTQIALTLGVSMGLLRTALPCGFGQLIQTSRGLCPRWL